MTEEEFSRLFPNVKWPKTFEGNRAARIISADPSKHIEGFLGSGITEDTMPPYSIGSLRNYQSTPRELLVDYLNRTFYGDDRAGRDRTEFLLRPIDVSPAAIPVAFYDTTRALGEGRYKDAIPSGITAIAPFAGKPVAMLSKAMKGGGQFGDVIENYATSARGPDAIAGTGNGIDVIPARSQFPVSSGLPPIPPRNSLQAIPNGHKTPPVSAADLKLYQRRLHPFGKSSHNDPTNVAVTGEAEYTQKKIVQEPVTPVDRDVIKSIKTRPLSERISKTRTIEAVKEALPQMARRKPEDWEVLFSKSLDRANFGHPVRPHG